MMQYAPPGLPHPCGEHDGGVAASLDRNRSLLPLPVPAWCSAAAGRPGGRRSRGRAAGRARQAGLLRELIQTLNQMDAGEDQVSRRPLERPCHIQELALEHLTSCCSELGGPPPDLTADAALRELQVSPAHGAEEPQTLAPLTFDLVSLPKAGAVARPLEELLGRNGPSFVKVFLDSKVLPSRLAAERKAEAKFSKPYLDPVLREPARRGEFTRRLLDAGMLDLVPDSAEACEEVGLFTVWKKNGTQRLVVDCRGSNFHFDEPEHVALASGASLSSIEIPDGQELWISGVDICDAFYHMGLPSSLRPFFSLPRVRAGDLGITELQGHALGPRDWVRPRFAVLPMGWSHALAFCQRVHENVLLERAGLGDADRLVDGRAPPPLGPGMHAEYVDNF